MTGHLLRLFRIEIKRILIQKQLSLLMLAHCETQLFEHYESITLESFDGNAKANAFYRKNGWTRIGSIPDPMSGARKWILEKRRDP